MEERYTFPPLTNNHEISAIIEPDTPPVIEYTIRTSVIGSGTISTSVNKAEAGDIVTITATPATGYKLDSIVTSPYVTITNNAFEMPASNVIIVATFVQDTPPTPTPGGDNIKMYVKLNGIWVPLFTN